MKKLELVAEKRKLLGTRHSKNFRRKGKIPAIVYGFGENYMLNLSYKIFLQEFQRRTLLSNIISIKLEQKKLIAVLREVQTDPVKDVPIHIDFQLVKVNVPIKLTIFVKVVNIEQSPGIKAGGILNVVKKFIILKCMPEHIPVCLELDVSGFEIGKSVHINDVQLPYGAVYTSNDNCTLLTISGRIQEKEEEQSQNEQNNISDIKE